MIAFPVIFAMISLIIIKPTMIAAIPHKIDTNVLSSSLPMIVWPISLINDGTDHFIRIKMAVNIPPTGNIYFDDKLSITSKNVSPKK